MLIKVVLLLAIAAVTFAAKLQLKRHGPEHHQLDHALNLLTCSLHNLQLNPSTVIRVLQLDDSVDFLEDSFYAAEGDEITVDFLFLHACRAICRSRIHRKRVSPIQRYWIDLVLSINPDDYLRSDFRYLCGNAIYELSDEQKYLLLPPSLRYIDYGESMMREWEAGLLSRSMAEQYVSLDGSWAYYRNPDFNADMLVVYGSALRAMLSKRHEETKFLQDLTIEERQEIEVLIKNTDQNDVATIGYLCDYIFKLTDLIKQDYCTMHPQVDPRPLECDSQGHVH